MALNALVSEQHVFALLKAAFGESLVQHRECSD